MFKDKRVVVTGGSGFVGTHYITELLSRGANVVTHTHERPLQIQDDRIEVLENINLEKIDDAMKLIDGADYVIHSAGKIGHPASISTDFQITLNQIVVITNTLEASYKCDVKGFVDINSSTGYTDKKYPVTEDEYWERRQNMNEASYHLHQTFNEDEGDSSLLYFDSDDGVALISAYCEVFDDEGFQIKLIDCQYCDIHFYHMQEIIDIFIALAEEFNIKMSKMKEQ